MFAEDITDFFSPSEFAEDGLLAGRPVCGNFMNLASNADIGQMMVQQDGPRYLLPADQVSNADHGATLVLPQGTFSVRRIDARGALTLLLLEVPA